MQPKLLGFDVYVIPAQPKLQLSPTFKYCTQAFRDDLNRWLLEQFGTRLTSLIDGPGRRIYLDPESYMMLRQQATAFSAEDVAK